MPFKHLMFANNCCIFAVKIPENTFGNKPDNGSLGSSMDRISLS